MMKNFIFGLFSLAFIGYLLIPAPALPPFPEQVVESPDAGDQETVLRRAYFTNLTRAEVMAYYKDFFRKSPLAGIVFPTFRLNYPPEEATFLVRDQTYSTFLEELVHPFRESLFINGFEPKDGETIFVIGGETKRQKITTRYIPSSYFVRISIALAALTLAYVLGKEWGGVIADARKI